MSLLMLKRMNPGGTPWGGYVAEANGVQVGECAFKSAPINGQVEVAYHTFAEFERQGFGTEMARELVAIARRTDSSLVVIAQTLRETNASTKILAKLGFTRHGTVYHPEDGEVWEWHLPPDAPA